MMKRLFLIAMLLLAGGTLWAQNTRNVLGAPVYYDTLGNVIGQGAPADSFYHRPKHHFRNRIENEFSSVFLEGTVKFGGDDLAVGGQVAWVPQRWGGYVGAMAGILHPYFTAGPVVRLSDCGDWVDWHLFAGLAVSRRVGAEIGMRLASPRQWGDFCWTSGALAVGYVNGASYFTIGLSLTFSSFVALTIW